MSDSKENVDVLKMYGEDSTIKRDEFLREVEKRMGIQNIKKESL